MRLFLDTEVYKNYFLALFMNEEGRTKRFEIFNGDASNFDAKKVLGILENPNVEIVTFNGESFDIPVLAMAVTTCNTRYIKRAGDRIIKHNLRPWLFYRDEGLDRPDVNHIDLIEVAPGMVGLKLYGGRLNSERLQELPIHHDAEVTEDQIELLRQYCKNDTLVTKALYDNLEKEIDLRRNMSKVYGVDLRSRSDAQIAEAVLKAEYARITKRNPPKVRTDSGSFYYVPPKYVKFLTDNMRHVLDVVTSAEMVIDENTGHVKMPKEIADLKIEIGDSRYKLGIGGLHSQESEVAHHTDDENILIDRDVASYYPNLMLNMNMQPGGFGEHFNTVYRRILDERLAAKAAGDKVKADSLKIVLNGTFGKTSSKYSTLYSPDFMIRTTITGQLTLLMLIEALELCGIPVVSANTDGIVIKCPRKKRDTLQKIIDKWEQRSGLETEETVYRSLYSRDVNNYIAVKEDGSAKAKGVYGPVTLRKNPQNPICAEAVIAHLTKDTPIMTTLKECRDITKFLTLRTVNGGAEKDGEPLGKAIRWYYATGVAGAIHYATNGNTVPRSDGAKPIMDLPETFPNDIDYAWYSRECEEILMSIGAKPRPFVEKVPRKNSNAWKQLYSEGKIVENSKGKWVWAEPK